MSKEEKGRGFLSVTATRGDFLSLILLLNWDFLKGKSALSWHL